MILLVLLLVLSALLHGYLVVRFGAAEHTPFIVFAVIYAALALAVLLAVPYAIWATLVMSVIGLVGLTVTFNNVPQRDKTMDRVIWVVDAMVVLYTAYRLF
jgi:hypothetical protein